MEIEADNTVHRLFYPMNNVVVFDEWVDEKTLGNPKLIILAGSRMTDACLDAVERRVNDGAVCVAAKWLLPEGRNKTRKAGAGK